MNKLYILMNKDVNKKAFAKIKPTDEQDQYLVGLDQQKEIPVKTIIQLIQLYYNTLFFSTSQSASCLSESDRTLPES